LKSVKRAFNVPVSVSSTWSEPVASMCTVKFSPPEVSGKFQRVAIDGASQLDRSPCGQSRLPVTDLFFWTSTSFSGRCSTVNVQSPSIFFWLASIQTGRKHGGRDDDGCE